MLVKQIKSDKPSVENEYTRVVHREGNIKANTIINEVFEPMDIKWRGFPVIKNSGLKLKDKYRDYDARIRFANILSEIILLPKAV